MQARKIKITAVIESEHLSIQGEDLWPEHLLPTFVGDERRLKQVLINLMKNAIKYTEDGQIFISAFYTEAPSSLLRISVRDTGQGIAPEKISTLFSLFGKLHRTAVNNDSGLGLGLTIVKQIVELSGGEVKVSSPGIGKGSTFSFSIPVYTLEGSPKKSDRILLNAKA